jgi:hypothetical protein
MEIQQKIANFVKGYKYDNLETILSQIEKSFKNSRKIKQ